jgi:hypothetical protein
MKLHHDSHLDHGLTQDQIAHIFERFADRAAFFIETIELPAALGRVTCDLMGPIVGDAPIPESEVLYFKRGAREWNSRMIEVAYPRTSRLVTVIAGPHDGEPCVLFTAYGGPLAPQEPDDPACKDVAASRAFWAEHALAVVV